MTLLELLREQCSIRSTKDGCQPQGQCGCCLALVNGRAVVTCAMPAKKAEGAEVVTLEGIPAGERVTFTITGLPQPSLVQRAQNMGASDGFQRGVLPSLAGLVLVGLLGFTLVRRRRSSAAMASGADAVHEEVIVAIATLDERFAAGEVEEEEYRLERADLMSRAKP